MSIIQKFFGSLKLKYIKGVKFYNVPKPFKFFLFSNDIPPKGYSQHGQDVLIEIILAELGHAGSWRDGNIVDVGCNDPIKFSNSLYFENKFNMFTLAIDPIADFEEKWSSKRPRSKFLNSAVGSQSGELVLNLCKGDSNESMFSSVSRQDIKLEVPVIEERIVEVRRLDDILEGEGITLVNLLSIDVEGYEEEVLRGINFNKVLFDFIVVENNSSSGFGSNRVRDILLSKGFIFYARIWNLDDIFISSRIMKVA